jgi:hypothetical protein
MYKVEYNTFLVEDCIFDAATRIDCDKVMENTNLLIGHKHCKEIYLIERFVTCGYGRELSHVCRYTWALELTLVRKVLFLGALHSKT